MNEKAFFHLEKIPNHFIYIKKNPLSQLRQHLTKRVFVSFQESLKKKKSGFLELTFPFLHVDQIWKKKSLLITYTFNPSQPECLIFFLNNSWPSVKKKIFLKKPVAPLPFLSLLQNLKKKFTFFSPLSGIQLSPININKPWGKEIWYSGIEKRGVSLGTSLLSTKKKMIPINQLLFSFKLFSFLNHGYIKKNNPILLKILRPISDHIYGQLYYELHEKKKEVYIISKISHKTYPNQVGKIRLGLNPKKIKSYKNFNLFRQAKLNSILAYKKVRFELDKKINHINQKTQASKQGPPPLSTKKIKKILSSFSPKITNQEKELRQKMESFSQYRDLRVGDTITINTHTPHSLQAGVEAIEFQTPHYERLIIAYPQKVLTQKDWDSEKALSIMKRKNTFKPAQILKDNSEIYLEKCLNLKGLQVHKIWLKQKKIYNLTKLIKNLSREIILFNLNGKIKIAEKNLYFPLQAEQAYLFPLTNVLNKNILIKNEQIKKGYILIAR